MEQEKKTDDLDIDEETAADDEAGNEEGNDDDTPTVADYEKLQERLAKAEKKLVEYKKAQKSAPKNAEGEDVEAKISAKLAEEKFFDKNPEFEEYREEIAGYVKKGLSYKEAATLVKSNDPSFGNKAKANAMNVTNGEQGSSKTTYTASELESMDQAEYNRVMDLHDQGKVKVVRA